MLGEGIETDMIEALTWLIISAREGNKDASAYVGPVPCSQPTNNGWAPANKHSPSKRPAKSPILALTDDHAPTAVTLAVIPINPRLSAAQNSAVSPSTRMPIVKSSLS